MVECPNCKTETDMHDEKYDNVRDQLHVSNKCSKCGYQVNGVE